MEGIKTEIYLYERKSGHGFMKIKSYRWNKRVWTYFNKRKYHTCTIIIIKKKYHTKFKICAMGSHKTALIVYKLQYKLVKCWYKEKFTIFNK